MSWKIVADSSCDFKQLDTLTKQTHFQIVPLSIQVGNEIFTDDEGLNIEDMMETMYASTTPSKSSCPSPDAFLQAYKGADNVIAITITSALSGSYNSAQLAKKILLEENSNVNIHVIDSLSAGGEVDLIVLELNRLISKGLSFEEVVKKITAYQKQTKLLFVLAKVDNLVKNGRLSKLVGRVVGFLNIRMVGKASSKGELELLQKARGQKRAIHASLEEMLKEGYQGGQVLISHVKNEKYCHQMSEKIKEKFPSATILFQEASGLCSFYAEKGGILLGYEVN